MASIKSVFSAGAGKVKEIAGLQYNDAAGGSLDVTLPISSNADITGANLSAGVGLVTAGSINVGTAAAAATSFAVAATSAGAGDTALATAGYVDAQVSVISSGVSLQNFTIPASGTTITSADIGKIVCLSGGDNAPLALADKDSDLLSNAIGVIKAVVGRVVTVQLDAEIVVGDLAAFSLGEAVFVGVAGAPAKYSALGTGDFATQVGYVSDVATDKMVIQIKSFGELA